MTTTTTPTADGVPGAGDLVFLRVLDLSTMHLSPQIRADLDSYPGLSAQRTPHDFGWWVYAPQCEVIDEMAAKGDWPPELVAIIKLARRHGCRYILFDCDAEVTEQLLLYED
ncbi:hypothetical protein [Kutzneria sp. 744]|uniref:DUF5983 family protein n=1 Tax=Kutzneria sp. (strain 744) TaxID=345341 RepID=UPI0003EED3DB|nr:hypothetical protein [Kutzneria sp. 744]EWM19724.1 hypothetical protein KUTG_10028 [Kutzneria sp. 744]